MADAYGPAALGVVLTGANADGARGLRRIVDRGGAALVQAPDSAEAPTMPRAALAAVPEARTVPLADIAFAIAEWADARAASVAGGRAGGGGGGASAGGHAPAGARAPVLEELT